MSSGTTPTSLFFASVEAGRTFVKIGMTSRAITATCRPMAITWLQPKFSSLDQMSFTFTGFTAKGKGGCFGGEKNSLMRELKNSFRLSPTPVPKDVWVKGAPLRSRTLIGRSVKNCFRLDQKLSGMRMSGASNFGTAEAGTGTAGSRPAADTLGFVISGGRRLINLPGTVFLFN